VIKKEEKKIASSASKNTLSQNLNFLISECRITLQELQKNTGVPVATIHRMRSNENINPTLGTLKPLADFFSISISQLIGDEPFEIDRTTGVYKINKERWIKVPLLQWNMVSDWPNKSQKTELPTIATDKELSADAFALTIEDEDQLGFPHGAIILIDPNKPPHDKDFILAQKGQSKKPSIKRYVVYDGKEFLMPVNPRFELSELTPEYEILGIIVQLRLDIK
jgi:SOS-response transcriptional repressor LexA